MIPFGFYYGGQMMEIPVQYTIIPYQPQISFLPIPTPFYYAPTPQYPIQLPNTEKPQPPRNQFPSPIPRQQTKKSPPSQQYEVKSEEKLIKRQQNPYRNIYTNLTNLILNLIICKKKVANLIERIDPTLENIYEFYQYIRDLKSYFYSYFNIYKVRKLIQGKGIPFYKEKFHKIFRIGAKYILEEKVPACLNTSKKISPQLIIDHFKARRQILKFLGQNKDQFGEH